MAYLSHFKHDIFISYARLNNKIPPGKKEGWVTRFHKELDYALSQRFERDGDVKIWRDVKEMDGSVIFGEAIPESIRDSGILLALTSPAYVTKRGYCHKELAWFHQKAKAETYGLAVSSRSRIVNVILQNLPRKEWLPELEGATGFQFNDSEATGGEGVATDPDDPLFKQQMRVLVDALTQTLQTLKPYTDVAPVAPDKDPGSPAKKRFTVFLAHTQGNLRKKVSSRVIKDLSLKNVEVLTGTPPPWGAARHERKVREAVEMAGLCVHLLDKSPGDKIEDDPDATYYQKQVELGAASGKPQLICVPKKLSIKSVDDPAHRDFLDGLENGARGRASYTFVRKTQPVQIVQLILQEINRIEAGGGVNRQPRPAALLDIHEKDFEGDYALRLSPVLLKRNLGLVINPAGDGPQQDMTLFDGVRQLVKVLIIVLGHVTEIWASRRLNLALQGAHSSLKFCGIYVPQVERPVDLSAFQILPNEIPVTLFFTPEHLNQLLNKYLVN